MNRKKDNGDPRFLFRICRCVIIPAVLLGAGCKEKESGTAGVLGPGHPGWKNPQCETCHWLPIEGHTAVEPHACEACHGANGACNPNAPGSQRVHEPTDDCTGCHGNRHEYTNPAHCVSCHFSAMGLDNCMPVPDGADVPPDAEDAPPEASDAPPDLADIPPDGADPAPDGDEPPLDGEDVVSDATGPELSTAVASGCFGWPDEAFTPDNHATVGTALGEGELAVELELKDVDGTDYLLSSLLAEKPVLMVFGSFT